MPNRHSLLFLGTSAFAVPSLKALAADPNFEVLAVITQQDKPVGRSQELSPPPIKVAAESLNLPVMQPAHITEEFPRVMDHPALNNRRPDFLAAVSYGQILSQEILDYPTIAPVNVHASLLPRWRGASPIQHAILEGDAHTGVTVQQMVRELDAGPILAQGKTPIGERETFTELHDRLATLGAELLVKTLHADLSPTPQSEDNVTLCRKLTREDGIVDAQMMTAEEIDRKVRALNPWPGVTISFQGSTTKILATSLTPAADAHALSCKDGSTLYLLMVHPSGKKPMSGADWERGFRK